MLINTTCANRVFSHTLWLFLLLLIAPDARSAGLGDAGVALSPDANSIHWNASKNAFSDRDFGASITYGSWLSSVMDDAWQGNVSVYKKFGGKQALAASVRHLAWGTYTLFAGNPPVNIGSRRTIDNAYSLAYSRQLGANFSMGLSLKYIHSSYPNAFLVNAADMKAASVMAGDISAYYRKQYFNTSTGRTATWSFGAVLANLGDRLNYNNGTASVYQEFLPTMLKLGGGLSVSNNDKHKINFILDASKLLTPTPGINPVTTSVLSNVWKSFSDAPGGFKEEMQEIILSGGVEYWYKNKLALRGGYFGEHKNKGGRRYFTTGAGVRIFKDYGIDFSYLIPQEKNSPLQQTYRISAQFDFGKKSV